MLSTLVTKELAPELEIFSKEKDRIEIYRGKLVEMPYTKPNHGEILLEIGYQIKNWIKKENGFGFLYGGEAGIKYSQNQKYSFDLGWSETQLIKDEIPTISLPLMIEVISEGNLAENLMIKVEDYLIYGAKEVWLVYPIKKNIQVYYPNNTSKIFKIGDTITPGNWMKGFSLEVKDIF